MNKANFIEERRQSIHQAELEIEQITALGNLFGDFWLNIAIKFSSPPNIHGIARNLIQLCGFPKNVPPILDPFLLDEITARRYFPPETIEVFLRISPVLLPITDAEILSMLRNINLGTIEGELIRKNIDDIKPAYYRWLRFLVEKYGVFQVCSALLALDPLGPGKNLELGFQKLEHWLIDHHVHPLYAIEKTENIIDASGAFQGPFMVERYFLAKTGQKEEAALKKLIKLWMNYGRDVVIFAMSCTLEREQFIELLQFRCEILSQFLQNPFPPPDWMDVFSLSSEEIIFINNCYEEVEEDSVDFAFNPWMDFEEPVDEDDEIFYLGFDQSTLNDCSEEEVRETEETIVVPPPENDDVPEEPEWEPDCMEEDDNEPYPPLYGENNGDDNEPYPPLYGENNGDDDEEEDDEDDFGPFGNGNQEYYEEQIPSHRYYDYSTEDIDAMDSDELDDYYGGDTIDQWLEDQD